jgi:hypothetical protein
LPEHDLLQNPYPLFGDYALIEFPYRTDQANLFYRSIGALHLPFQAGGPPDRPNPKEMIMFAKTILAALVLAGTSLTFVADASAATGQAGRNGELHQLEFRSVHYYRVGQSPLCPADHSYQECFYGG